jgi:mRNA-degrading endonuclease RelE of RelBE toxin-antitoxin system
MAGEMRNKMQNCCAIRHSRGKNGRGVSNTRVGDYRIIYQMDRLAEKLVILKIGHRREVYG